MCFNVARSLPVNCALFFHYLSQETLFPTSVVEIPLSNGLVQTELVPYGKGCVACRDACAAAFPFQNFDLICAGCVESPSFHDHTKEKVMQFQRGHEDVAPTEPGLAPTDTAVTSMLTSEVPRTVVTSAVPTAASRAAVCAAPLGPVDVYDWLHEGREGSAELFLEKTSPWRIIFRTYDEHGNVQLNSGMHGNWSQDVCKESITKTLRDGRIYMQREGDVKITLDDFRYVGTDAEWTHDDMMFEKKVGDDRWVLLRSSCGTKHHIEFKLKGSAAVVGRRQLRP